MFVSWRTFRAQTGVVETDLVFGCQRCGTQCPMRVRTQGIGSSTALYGAIGGGADQARQAAAGNAQANAHQAARFVRCPNCSAAAHDAFLAELVQRSDARMQRALPTALVLGVLSGLLLGGLGLLDAAVTLSPTVAGLGAGLALFGLVLATRSRPLPIVGPPMAEVWLSWTTPQGPQWIPGQMVSPPRAEARRAATVLGPVSASLGAVVAIVALVTWSKTFGTVYVIDTSGKVDLDAKVDGHAVTAKRRAATDGKLFAVAVRTDAARALTVGGEAFDVRGKGDWLVVAGPQARDVCVYEREAVYAASPGAPSKYTLLWKGGKGILNLPHAYPHMLEPPPRTVTVKQGQSERRWVLRAFKCGAAADD